MFKKQTIIKNQQGMASMVIVILIMTLLSLIVISMTQNANREQQQALDRQLNSQAYYAAESGVNDARDYYTKFANDPSNPAPESKDNCDGLGSAASRGDQFPGDYSSIVGSDVNKYTCVLYDATPASIELQDVSRDQATLMPIQDKGGARIQSLTFTWKTSNNTDYSFSSCPAAGFASNLDDNCDAGVLRIELINIDDSIIHNRAALINADFLAYASPSSSGAVPVKSYGSGVGTPNQGVSWRGGCTGGAAGQCSITISGINQNKLLLHLRSLYKDNYVKVTGKSVAPDGSLKDIQFMNGQLMIDSTGRAGDVLKRVQVRVPLNAFGQGIYPEFALQTTDAVCKLQKIIPTGFDVSSTESCP